MSSKSRRSTVAKAEILAGEAAVSAAPSSSLASPGEEGLAEVLEAQAGANEAAGNVAVAAAPVPAPKGKATKRAAKGKGEGQPPSLVVIDSAGEEDEEARAARARKDHVEVKVRRLHRRDLNRTWEFLKLVFRDVNRETVEYQRPRSKNRFLDVYEEKGEQLLFEVGDQVVGYAECAFDATGADNWINPRYFEKRGMRPLYVEELAVHPDYQGKGVGGFMLDQLQHLARVRGCTHLVLEVAENNESALTWYRRRNFFKLDAAIFLAQKVPAEPELLPPRKLPLKKVAAGVKGKKPNGGARRAPRSPGAGKAAKRR